jgi:uncharacterized protein YndB with AHSA1/START domain
MDVHREIPVPPTVVWEQLARTSNWPGWGLSILSVDPADAAVVSGLRGTVRTVVGVRLPFEVTEVVPGRSWSWRVAGVPATGHRVEPTASGTRVTITVPRWAPIYAPVCALALRRLERLVAPA